MSEQADPATFFEFQLSRNHTVIVLVSVVDRRLVPALRFVSRLGCTNTWALHVAADSYETRRLMADWMTLGLTWLPLHIFDAAAGDVATTVCDAVQHELDWSTNVTVVVPELDLSRWWHPLLHRRSARRIAAELQDLPDVTAVIVPFAAPAAGASRH